jgi:hypothetical protein
VVRSVTVALPVVVCAVLWTLAVRPPGALASENANWGTAVEMTPPANAASNPKVFVEGVSCPSVGNCSVAGSYADSSGYRQGFVLSETAGTWGTAAEVMMPAGAASNPQSGVDALSCPSSGDCTAVGGYTDNTGNSQAFTLSETAGAWGTAIEAVLPAGAASNPEVTRGLVSCPSVGRCSAVSAYTDSEARFQGLLLNESSGTWEGGAEATMPANVESSHPGVTIGGLSCASAGNCTAVGEYNSDEVEENGFLIDDGFLLTETAGVWGAGVEASAPANAIAGMHLNGVSCPSVGNCSAVGDYLDSLERLQGLLLSETSGTWGTAVEAKAPANGGSAPDVFLTGGVQCASAGNCTAIGSYLAHSAQGEGLLLSETAGSWGAGVEASLPGNAQSEPFVSLDGLSCPSAGDCAATGEYTDSSDVRRGLLLTESSGTWGPGLQVSLPADAAVNPEVSFGSVSCASPGNCTAVGDYTDDQGHKQGLLLLAARVAPTLSASAPASGFAGDAISSSAVLVGGSAPAGTITFTVFGPQPAPPSSCAYGGTAVGTASVSGNRTYQPSTAFVPSTPGEYWWYASYSGDAGNEPTASTCGALMAQTTVDPKATPTLAVSSPASGIAGSPISPPSISATLSGGSSATGTIRLTVFGPQSSPPSSCASGGTTVGSASVSGDGSYQPSSGFTPASPGDYWWYAGYSGDAANDQAASTCGSLMAETVVTAAQAFGSGVGSGNGTVIGTPTKTPAPPTKTPAPPTKTPAPTLSGVRLGFKRFVAKKGVTLKFTVSQSATIEILIAETVKGHKLRGVCRPSAKRGMSCRTTVKKRTSMLSGAMGSNTVDLRLAGLGKGSYTATVTAENASGRSTPIKLPFTIVHK